MRLNENPVCISGSRTRSAAPAPAREILRTITQSSDIDLVVGLDFDANCDLNPHLAAIRRQIQNGTYQINLAECSSKLVDEFVSLPKSYQR